MKIAVVIPAFRVKREIVNVFDTIPDFIDKIYVVDDACPESSGVHLSEKVKSDKLKIIFHKKNTGVGGAVKTGFRHALDDECDIIIKLDGDGQMDPEILVDFLDPIREKLCDYAKGNRFNSLNSFKEMPKLRIFGNLILSFITKFSSGYYNVNDPTNGYFAINSNVLKILEIDALENRYFFESDLLFQLNLVDACILDVPMNAKYGSEISNLKILPNIFVFLAKNLRNLCKRITIKYFLQDFNMGSVYILFGCALSILGSLFGLWSWTETIIQGTPRTSGTVALAMLPLIVGFQLNLSFINFDLGRQYKEPLCRTL
ncbi:glycosyltransferase family 2 protein [bacterium]|nr:glycosyltransferase family 2 protein [bacterium]